MPSLAHPHTPRSLRLYLIYHILISCCCMHPRSQHHGNQPYDDNGLRGRVLNGVEQSQNFVQKPPVLSSPRRRQVNQNVILNTIFSIIRSTLFDITLDILANVTSITNSIDSQVYKRQQLSLDFSLAYRQSSCSSTASCLSPFAVVYTCVYIKRHFLSTEDTLLHCPPPASPSSKASCISRR
jgi:hypothetical protein